MVVERSFDDTRVSKLLVKWSKYPFIYSRLC